METTFRCELLSWGRIYQMARRLALRIRKAGFQPDVVVAIARGGYIPARILCDFMDIFNLTSIRVEHYTAGAHKKQSARISSPLATDVREMKVLVVDDVSDTGDTLELALDHIKSFSPAEVKVATLDHKMISTVEPDFYARKVVKWRWIIYPWAVIEDITGFIKRMEKTPGTPEEAARRLEKERGIKVPKKVLEDVYAFLELEQN
jgi:hypoxanthine phosphoribosyltransferase